MHDDLVGRAVNAVLVPPQAARFAALTGVDLDRLVLNVTGWNKLVLLDDDRAFLFPRSATGVEWFEREIAAYRALAETGLAVVPHLDQLLAEDGRLTGIIDWETARVDHPFWDFDLGEWGTGLWRRRRREFTSLWARGWRAYAAARGLDTDSRPMETAFRLRHALRLLDDPGDPAVVGTLAEQLADLSANRL